MKNWKFNWLVLAALGVAAIYFHFHSPKRAGEPSRLSIGHLEHPYKKRTSRTSTGIFTTEDRWGEHPREPFELATQTLAQLQNLLTQDPSDQNGHAAELLNDLCRTNQFETALRLADSVPSNLRPDWLKIIFNRWAGTDPQSAMKSVDTIQAPDERASAFQSAAAGWNSADPAGLANFAIHLDDTNERDYALALALNNWSLQDPAGLATWLNTLPHGAEFDIGVALMLSKTDGANRSPELAMQWVENISDPTLKQKSFTHVLAEWLQTDTAAARQYVTTAQWLDTGSRAKILTSLGTLPQ